MCCCDCLFVEALIEAGKVDKLRQAEPALQEQITHHPFVSVDRVPERLCGWSMLPLLHRRWRGQSARTLAS